MMKYVLWLSTIWITPLMSWMLINEAKFKKNIAVGVTLPGEAHEDPEVVQIIQTFIRNSWIVCAAVTVIALLAMFTIPASLQMTLWAVWLMFVIIVPYIPYVRANGKLKELKTKRGWVQKKQTVTVDTSAVSSEKWLSPLLFVPPVIIALVPMFFDRDMAVMYVTMASCCVLFFFSYRYLYRNKAEMVDRNSELTKALTQIRRYTWGKMWIVSSYIMALYSIAMWISTKHFMAAMGLTLLITVLLCVFAFRLEFRLRGLQERLTKNSGTDWYVDDDDHWLGGIIYWNPDDDRLIINQRVGMNSTFNLAKPAGKVLAAFLVLTLMGLPFLGTYLDYAGRKEITVTLNDQTVTAQAGRTNYSVTLSDIENVELLEQLPDDLQRRVGTGLETLYEGRFRSTYTGDVTVLLDPGKGPFLLIRTEEKTYLFGVREQGEIQKLYEQIRK
ncbi:MAG: hypothetical protein K6A40_10890 [Solobacterium sp.]|nr:hypothetical protein [Solobacterium sp.]